MKKALLFLIILGMASYSFAWITNITKVTELSGAGVADCIPRISGDELEIYFLKSTDLFDPATDSYYNASRLVTTDPFSGITNSFSTALSSPAYEGSFWVSGDGLRIYFTSARYGDNNLFFSSRTSTGDSFSSPTIITELSLIGVNEAIPILCDSERTIYFISDKSAPPQYCLYRATRPNISSAFGPPSLVSEISSSYGMMYVSEDELEMILSNYEGYHFYYSSRSSVSDPFSAPALVMVTGNVIAGCSMNSDFSRMYYATFTAGYDFDIYSADFSPPATTPTPTPTSTPVLPEPAPDCSIAALKSQIEAFTGFSCNPHGGVFDSQGRYIFFDQFYSNDYAALSQIVLGKSKVKASTIGTDQLIRMTPGSPPSFEIIATATDLATQDSRWTDSYYEPFVGALDVLSDDSIVLLSLDSLSSTQYVLRVVPGAPPQVSKQAEWALATFPDYPTPLVVDRTSNPNILYFAMFTDIYKIEANQTVLTPTNWYTYSSGYVYDMVIDKNSDVIYAGADLSYYKVEKIDKDTKAITIIADNLDSAFPWFYYSTLSLAINPINEDILGLYSVLPPLYGYYVYDLFAIYKLKKQGDGSYVPMNYVVSQQVFGDPDVDPYTSFPVEQLTAPSNGFAIDPTGTYLYITNSNQNEDFLYYDTGSMHIIRILTDTATSVRRGWEMYE